MEDELARRKATYRALFSGEPLARIPLEIRVSKGSEFTVREQFQDGDKQLEAALQNARATWQLGESTDSIPAMRPDVGCSCLASAFGAEYYWGHSPDQTPGIREKVAENIDRFVETLRIPDPTADGWLPEGIRRIALFADAGGGFIPVSLLDAAGGLNVAADLMGTTELLVALHTNPRSVHRLLACIQRLFIATIEAGIDAAGGEEFITTTDFADFWFPEGYKGHASDDISANISPQMYLEFSLPYHEQVYAKYGRGGLHNCGPNPCHGVYLAGDHAPRSVDLSDAYSHADLPALRRSFRKRAFVYMGFDNRMSPGTEPVSWFREIMEIAAPDLIVVPVLTAGSAEEGRVLFDALKPIACEYAMRTDWGWDC